MDYASLYCPRLAAGLGGSTMVLGQLIEREYYECTTLVDSPCPVALVCNELRILLSHALRTARYVLHSLAMISG